MANVKTIREVLEYAPAPGATEREKAVALHDFVRDNIKFGFNKYFDAAPPDYTLTFGYGHCNPKSRLMNALFHAAGLESYQHFVVISKEILNDAIAPSRFWMIPKEICHSYVEVKVDGHWCSIDSFIVDTPLLRAGLAVLAKENRSIGYGVRLGSVNTWDGRSNAFSQFEKNMMIEDHGRIEDLEAYFRDKKYRHVVMGMRFNTMFEYMGETGMAPMNAHIDKIRQTVDKYKVL